MSSLGALVAVVGGGICLLTACIGMVVGAATLLGRARTRRFWGGTLILWWTCALSAAYGILAQDGVTAVAGLLLWTAGTPIVCVFGRGT